MAAVSTGNISFTCGEEIGSGAFGKVFLAQDNNDKTKRYALKKIKCSENSELAEVKEEFDSLTTLSHQNIIKMYGITVSQEGYFEATFSLLLEYCHGGNLSDRLHQPGSKSLSLRWMRMITDAIEYLHENHIIHQDLKPNNILLSSSGGIKVADFGLAKRFTLKAETQTWRSYYIELGTDAVCYVAPEMLAGRLTYKADIFSMGVVFFAITERMNMEFNEKRCYGVFVEDEDGKTLPLGVHMFNQGKDVDIPFSRDNWKRREIEMLLKYDAKARPTAQDVKEALSTRRLCGLLSW